MPEKPRNRIELYAHCANCAPRKPGHLSQADWSRIEAGLTSDGLQVWCRRCRMEIGHFTPESLRSLLDAKPQCDCCPGGKHVKGSA